MASGYKFNYNNATVDLSDVYMEKQYFIDYVLYGWGLNRFGQIGNGTADYYGVTDPAPVLFNINNWKQITSGTRSSAGIKSDGSLWTWGFNSYGELGDNTTAHRSSPIQTVAAGTNWKQVMSGFYHTAAVKLDGTLWAWGLGTSGELGDNSVVSKSSPVQTVAGGGSWSTVACGNGHTAAVKLDGTLWLWGSNYYGQLGDNTTISKSSPVQTIAGGGSWSTVACGDGHTAAVKLDGTLWLWGSNGSGQLGDNTTISKSSPVQTIDGQNTWSIGLNKLSCSTHTTAIKADGTLWVWGYNYHGQLGDNTTTSKSSPVQTITGGGIWSRVSSGDSHTAAIKTDGTLWVWGYNYYGNLANYRDYTTRYKFLSPIQTSARGENWYSVSCSKVSSGFPFQSNMLAIQSGPWALT